jgi:hypothetical protein
LDLVFIYRFLVLFVLLDLKSLVLCVYFVDCCLSFCTFSFGHCVVCSSSIYGFWWPLLHLQTLLITCLSTYITDMRSVIFIMMFLSLWRCEFNNKPFPKPEWCDWSILTLLVREFLVCFFSRKGITKTLTSCTCVCWHILHLRGLSNIFSEAVVAVIIW